jgi:hypothetical protein
MLLTLPSDALALVAPLPSVAIMINGKRHDGFTVSDPFPEIPVVEFSHCVSCGCKASDEIRRCQAPVCPSRDRKAA